MAEEKKRKITGLIKEHIMSSISAITIVILLFTASVAWFVLQRTGLITDIGTKVSEWDFIVSLESQGECLTNDQEIDILANSIKTNDIGKGKLAPGSYGSIDLYVRTTSDVASAYVLTIDNAKLMIDVDSVIDTEYTTEKLTEYLHKHIKFYSDEAYTKEISLASPVEGELSPGEEEKVTIYWIWHYDGEFLCTENTSEEEKQIIMDDYDEEDVIISEHREYINGSIRIAVSATQKKPTEA